MAQQQIRTAIIGFGVSARIFHLPFLDTDSRFLVGAFLERHGTASQARYPQAKIFATIDGLLAWQPDLVIICSPNDCHYSQARQCLEAGCHVIVEKPFTITVGEAESLIDLAEKQKRILTVFHNRRLDGDFLTVQDIVRAATLGRIVEAEIRYDRWTPGLRPKAWKENGSPGSSLLEDLGSHLIDQALTLWGMPKLVTALLACQRAESRVDDAFDLRLDYANTGVNSGLSVRLKGGMLVREGLPRWSLFGTGGSFVKSGTDPQESHLLAGLSPFDPVFGLEEPQFQGILHHRVGNPDNGETWVRESVTGRRGAYAEFHRNIAAAILEGAELLVKPIEALAVVRIIAAARLSSLEHRSVAP